MAKVGAYGGTVARYYCAKDTNLRACIRANGSILIGHYLGGKWHWVLPVSKRIAAIRHPDVARRVFEQRPDTWVPVSTWRRALQPTRGSE